MLRLSKVTAATFTLAIALVILEDPLCGQRGQSALRPDVELVANEGAFEFDGASSGLDLGRSSIVNLSHGDFTIHVWVKFASLSNDSGPCYGPGCDMSIVDKMIASNGNGWRLLKQSDNRVWFCLGGSYGCDPSSPTTVISQTLAVTDLWYSVAAVKTSGQISIYVNGILEGTTPLGDFYDDDFASLRVGENWDDGAYLNGEVAQFQLFNSAMRAPLVRAMFEMSKVLYGY